MARYRAVVGNNPIGPWRAYREVAQIDAVEAREASLDPYTGRIFTGAFTRIQTDAQDEPLSREDDLLAEAVSTLHSHDNRTPVYAKELAERFEHESEIAERWRRIGRLAEDLLRRAESRRGPEIKRGEEG